MTPARKEPPGTLEIKINDIQRNVENTHNRLDLIDQRLQTLTESVQTLTDQVGRMTEGLTRLENLLTNGFDALVQQTAKRDEQIDRLLSIMEKLVSSKVA